jgi:putative glutamine amidotransferase
MMSSPMIGLTTARVQAPNQSDQFATPLSYIQAVITAGGIPLLIPAVLSETQLRETFGHLDGLVFTGGGDMDPVLFDGKPHPRVYGIDPDRDRTEMALVKMAVEENRPFLGICRGIQVINVALGGTLYTDIEGQLPGASRHDFYPDIPRNHLAHEVTIEPSSRLANSLGGVCFEVNSLHHQGLESIAPGLQVTAHASDGLVEAIELPDHPFGLGVQWHPEWLQEHEAQRALFKAFVRAAYQSL